VGPVHHQIRFIEDDELPNDRDWTLIRTRHAYYFFIKRSGVTEEALTRAWVAYAHLDSGPPYSGPRLRSA
jgi:hypothetical protein